MAVFVALLRGVNVGGNVLKMNRVRELCEELGLKKVRTYVQSGNIVFESGVTASRIAETLEGGLRGECRLPVPVLIRTPKQLRKVLDGNPFVNTATSVRKGSNSIASPVRLYVAFLAKTPSATCAKRLKAIEVGKDRHHLTGKEVYLDYPEGAGRSKLTNALLERILETRATTRNWNTVNALCEMASGQ